MKTISALIVMLLISLTLSETALAGGDLKKGPKKFSKNSVASLIMGLNSDNKGVVIGCANMAGDYKIKETVESLAQILNSDNTYDVKTAAVYALYQIQTKDALVALKKACAKNKCPFLKQSAEVFLNHYLVCHPDEDVTAEEDYLAVE